jgi:CBS domain-containing protein
MRIREVVAAKPDSTVVTVSPGATVRELVALLAEHNVGALVVSSDGATVEGIVSDRDVVRRLHSEPDALSATVDTIMTSDVHTAGPDDSLDDMMSLMTDQRIRHVPVCDAGRMVGIISIGDVVKHRIKVLEFERDQLDSYVHQT